MSTSSSAFIPAATGRLNPETVRLYESKYFHCYNHRWASYDSSTKAVIDTDPSSLSIDYAVETQHYVQRDEVEDRLKDLAWPFNYLIAWRDITNSTNERTAIFAILPRAGIGNNAGLLIPQSDLDPTQVLTLVSNLNSLVFDYASRQKIGGTHLNSFILEQLPVLGINQYSSSSLCFLSSRAGMLSFTSRDLNDAANEFGIKPQDIPPDKRHVLQSEIDAFIAHLYGLTRDELRYILDPADLMGRVYPSETFRVLKNNEIRQFGEYRTQRLVLEAWDRLFGG
jgi:hypothetical protein